MFRLTMIGGLTMFTAMALAEGQPVSPEIGTKPLNPGRVELSYVPFQSPAIVLPDGTFATQAPAEPVRAEPAPEPPTLPVYQVVADRLNVRSGPSTGHEIVDQLADGDLVAVRAVLDNGWAQISVEGAGTAGFVAARFLARPQT